MMSEEKGMEANPNPNCQLHLTCQHWFIEDKSNSREGGWDRVRVNPLNFLITFAVYLKLPKN